MKIKKHLRPAFTLLELLVVVAIIGTLMALTAAAIFRLKNASLETRTNETLSKLQGGFDLQYKSAVDLIRKEPIPDVTLFWAGGDADLAKAIHMKLRLRQEFPQTSTDLQTPASITGNANVDTALKTLYAPKLFFTKYPALAGAPYGDPDSNAALLMLVLSQARGGSSFSPDQIGTNALGNVTVGGTSFKAFVDGYGNRIMFYRQFPVDRKTTTDAQALTLMNELNAPPYVSATAITGKMDAIDPTGKLTAWANRSQLESWLGIPCDGDNRGPFAVSAGMNEAFGDGDDLYSFRLKGTGKAN
ncbi:type II secretion system protein [Zavarzinella formosa]|uniref:type II secretion system protein n=1 Tax=Zavarzinella formosa TaxID=360055 RepID=UPI00049833CE|nr:prepilin-type N-terminal cleavage/methylation domain-containing protein [Zavarzinella formosa]